MTMVRWQVLENFIIKVSSSSGTTTTTSRIGADCPGPRKNKESDKQDPIKWRCVDGFAWDKWSGVEVEIFFPEVLLSVLWEQIARFVFSTSNKHSRV